MLRALVVDDEPPACAELEALLLEVGHVEVVGRSLDAVGALPLLRRERPDVLFLDVEMPGISGLELLGMIDDAERPRHVVFVTAHEEFAVQAFEKAATDYLLKPVQRDRLARTVERLRSGWPAPAPALAVPPIRRVPCALARAIKLVPVEEIELVRSSEAGVYVVTAQGEFFTELTLGVLEARAGLLRCHRQYLVNADRIDEISMAENSLAVLRTRSGAQVPVSRRHLADIRAALGVD
jgi:two-component system LytT family response regulator